MTQTKALLKAISEFLFGKKYYANIVNLIGTDHVQIACHIFHTPEAAAEHRRQIDATASYQWIETISFRSRTLP